MYLFLILPALVLVTALYLAWRDHRTSGITEGPAVRQSVPEHVRNHRTWDAGPGY